MLVFDFSPASADEAGFAVGSSAESRDCSCASGSGSILAGSGLTSGAVGAVEVEAFWVSPGAESIFGLGAGGADSSGFAASRGAGGGRGGVTVGDGLLRAVGAGCGLGFAETGAWPIDAVARTLARLVGMAPGRLWYGYHVSAVDDTKVHRSGEYVWGTCTFHEYTARCPNRAGTVRAHNWVVLGALLHEQAKPAWFLPIAGYLYFRQSQLPCRQSHLKSTRKWHSN